VSLARAAYSNSDVVLLDDPLSAVDAYVGKAILENCILNGPFKDRTRILVTHALHVLDKTDYIYVVENGVIVAQGDFNVGSSYTPASPSSYFVSDLDER
jgi:ATP-binding cassette, subfamily C (CFTR/MRP), member 1